MIFVNLVLNANFERLIGLFIFFLFFCVAFIQSPKPCSWSQAVGTLQIGDDPLCLSGCDIALNCRDEKKIG